MSDTKKKIDSSLFKAGDKAEQGSVYVCTEYGEPYYVQSDNEKLPICKCGGKHCYKV